MLSTPRLELVSAGDAVAQRIRESVLSGHLRPGTRIIQEDLAAELGVSRQPVREALGRLLSEGFVVRMPNGSWSVRRYSDREVLDNYHLRELLESDAAAWATKRGGQAHVPDLHRANVLLQSAIEQHDTSAILSRNLEVHAQIWDLASMPALTRTLHSLWTTTSIGSPLLVPGRAESSIHEHEEIIAAVASRHARAARVAMRRHIMNAKRDFLGTLG